MKKHLSPKFRFLLFILLSTFSICAQNNLTPPDSALIACFPFSGNANDYSGFNNNGTVNGAVLVADRFGNPNSAYSFNGTNQNIIIQNYSNMITGNEVSVSFWSTAPGYATRSALIMTPDDPSNRFNIHIYYGNQQAGSQTYWDFGNISNNGRLSTSPSTIPNPGVWDHWAFVTSQANSYMKCYKNGVLVFTKTGSSTFSNASPKDLLIGGGIGTGNSFLWFNGSLDDIKIYSRVLTQNDVTSLYNSTISCCPIAQSPSISPAASICSGNTAVLNASGTSTIQWLPAPNSTVVLGTGSTYTTPALGAGTYTYYAVSTNSCGGMSPASSVVINVAASPNLSASSTASIICRGQPVTLNAGGATSYSWQPGALSGPSVSVTPQATTVYTVTASNVNSCTASQTVLVTVDDCTGIQTFANNNSRLSIWPNPSSGIFSVSYPCNSPTEVKVDIMDFTGKLLCSKYCSFSASVPTYEINLGAFAKGVYFVRVGFKSGKSETVRIVKEQE